MESIHEKLERVRKPRVHIKYEVETEGGMLEKEIPFVVGVMGDFSGDSLEPVKPLRERKFIQIDRDNFDEVMKTISPGFKGRVPNKLSKEDSELSVQVEFTCMEDFEPNNIVEKIPALKALKEARDKLRDLLSEIDKSEAFEQKLENVLKHQDLLNEFAQQQGISVHKE